MTGNWSDAKVSSEAQKTSTSPIRFVTKAFAGDLRPDPLALVSILAPNEVKRVEPWPGVRRCTQPGA
jgi:hypothetical protein